MPVRRKVPRLLFNFNRFYHYHYYFPHSFSSYCFIKLSNIFFFYQASIIARKKEGAASTLQETREELVKLEMEAEEKRSQVKQGDGEEVLKGEEVRF